jgi:D-alanyl-D-alanine carboxypeptidase
MDAFADATGFTQTRVNVGFRSLAKQQELYEKYPNSAALPGCSDYHTGASVTLDRYDRETGLVYPLGNSSESLWLRENAHKYGFTFRYPTEKSILTGYDFPWWIRYVGIPHATYMYDRFFCLEEYLAYLAENHRYDEDGSDHLRVTCDDGCVYEIYYVEGATEGLIQVPVPSNREYTVSGDNKKGFIVTFLADVVDKD